MTEPKIEFIDIDDLVLWTENPRDSIDENMDNQDIAIRAFSKDEHDKWKLKILFKTMGDSYDYSELPTVAYIEGKPVVFDGNRRVLIGKIIHGCVNVSIKDKKYFSNFVFPEKVPCSICCNKKQALKKVDRKHAYNGTWDDLERDIFKHKHMEEDMSVFLAIEEKTGIISDHPLMNQRFVKEEVFSQKALDYLEFSVENDMLVTPYNDEDLMVILNKTVALVNGEIITTRKQRGKLIDLLLQDAKVSSIIPKDKDGKTKPDTAKKPDIIIKPPVIVKPKPRNKTKRNPLFGEYTLNFKDNIIENLFLDLKEIHNEIIKDKYSEYATMIIAMGLRLLCEVADKKHKRDLKTYIDIYFDDAETELTEPEQRSLVTHNVRKKNMARLLNEGAHKNADALSREQTVALSLIIVKILEETHGTKK